MHHFKSLLARRNTSVNTAPADLMEWLHHVPWSVPVSSGWSFCRGMYSSTFSKITIGGNSTLPVFGEEVHSRLLSWSRRAALPCQEVNLQLAGGRGGGRGGAAAPACGHWGLLCTSPCLTSPTTARNQQCPESTGQPRWDPDLAALAGGMQQMGPRPDLDVFRPLFYLGKLPEAPKSPRPITPLLLLNLSPNADGHKMFFGLSQCLQRWGRFVLGKTWVCCCRKRASFSRMPRNFREVMVAVKTQQELIL